MTMSSATTAAAVAVAVAVATGIVLPAESSTLLKYVGKPAVRAAKVSIVTPATHDRNIATRDCNIKHSRCAGKLMELS
jgi:hypothetical protein